MERLPDGTILIVGGGPVGLLLSTVLAFYGVKSVVLERNKTTTKWPKMDLTNGRSMEIFRRLGLAEGLRARGVPSHFPYTVLISSGLSRPKAITQWLLPSVDDYRKKIRELNDGSLPLEPYQRISQAIFEAWLKEYCDANPLIDLRYGWKVTDIALHGAGPEVQTVATNVETGACLTLVSQYVAGCDGGNSKIRTRLEIPLDGGPTPGYVLLVHFKSRDLTRLQKQGQFWHIFSLVGGEIGGAVIAQDEVDTWTTHLFLPLDANSDEISSEDAVYTILGGMGEKYKVEIDEILVRSTYRPNIAVARSYSALGGRVFLAGDAAHQNIPTGGYGMNMGLADAYDLGWKLAAVINKYGHKGLLDSYELERRPVAFLSVEHSKIHLGTHGAVAALLSPDPSVVNADTSAGNELRQRIHEHYQLHDGENKDLGIEMGYYYESPVLIRDGLPPKWNPKFYTPTTVPGSRAPHVFLKDGTAIFDLYGNDFTLIEFPKGQVTGAQFLLTAAKDRLVPVKHVSLPGEEHAAKIWEKNLVLVRPDGFVAWRGDYVPDLPTAKEIVERVVGLQQVERGQESVAFNISGSDQISTQTKNFELEKAGELQG